ncbi:MAG TPA: hypothetical protein DF383_05765 [Deltaproteobacteria bacterium]|nr:hypothetical protein [Deltaproteobacteria bacterium]
MATLFLMSCGSGSSGGSNSDASPKPPIDIHPDIHENVPPPSSAIPSNSAENFFKGKEAYDQFSAPLKERIYQSFSIAPGQDLSGKGQGYYNTLLGRTAPVLYQKPTATVALAGTEGGCDPTSFLCLDSPESGFATVQPGVDVSGKIDLNQLAVFGANDPVLVVSIFNSSGGGASAEIPVLPADVQTTSDPNVGKFSVAAGLSGGGNFTIVVSGYRVVNGGNELFSLMVKGTRIEAPQIEFVNAVPSPLNKLAAAGHENDPVNADAVIASEFLNVKVKLLTAGGAGLQVRFDDYNEAGVLQSSVVAMPNDEGADVFFTGAVVLHQGLNKIKVTAHSPALDELLGAEAPAPSVVNFSVFNADGGPRLKIISPEKSGIVAQTVGSGQQVDLQFCYTFVPSQAGSGSTPVFSDICRVGQLGFDPEIYLNGQKIVGAQNILYDGTQGIFTVKLEPRFGINIYEIKSTSRIAPNRDQTDSSSYFVGTFAFGTPMKLIESGQIAGADTFTARGLNLDLDQRLFTGDIKTMLEKFLNRPETQNLVQGLFKKTAATHAFPCYELDQQINSPGNTSIEFLEGTFLLGSAEVKELAPRSDGTLRLRATIHGMHGKADLKAVGGRIVTHNGKDIGFLPLSIDIARLDVNLAVAFKKNAQGVQELDLKQIPGEEIFSAVGDGELGNYITVDVSRNPYAAGVAYLDEQQGIIKRQFKTSLDTTFVCGIEEGLKHPIEGAFGKGLVDLENLTGYNRNLFRLPLRQDLLGKTLRLDIAYNLLKAENIRFDAAGMYVSNMPLRFNPDPEVLQQLAHDFTDGIIGTVSRWSALNEAEPTRGSTTPKHLAALGLGEDALNQALAAASLAGMIDLDIDANWYTDNHATPAKAFAPQGGNDSRLANGIDVNLDGHIDDGDKKVPLLLQVRSDKRVPPMVSLLSKNEVAELVAADAGIDPEARLLRVMIPNLELAVYRTAPVPESQGGVKTFCEKTIPTGYNSTLDAKGLCQVPPESKKLVPLESLASGETCSEADLVKIPARNGAVVSYEEGSSDFENPKPLYRIKANLLVHAEIKGVKRAAAAADFLNDPNPPEKTKLQMRIVPNTLSGENPIFLTAIQVLENNTNKSDAALISDWEVTLTGALGSHCERFNEILVPFPERFPADASAEPLLPDFGVDFIDLGAVDPADPATLDHMPGAYVDDSRLYLDLLMYVGLDFTE